MKRVKMLKKWGIYELNIKEQKEYNFSYAVIHPDNTECGYNTEPSDTDIECETLEQTIECVTNY